MANCAVFSSSITTTKTININIFGGRRNMVNTHFRSGLLPFSQKSGQKTYSTLIVRSTSQKGTSTDSPRQFEVVSTTEDVSEASSSEVAEVENVSLPLGEEACEETSLNVTKPVDTLTTTEAIQEESLSDSANMTELLSFVRNKFDTFEDKSKLLIYGGSALLALWLSATMIEVIESIPLFPKIMELVGFGYTVWFVYRYLLFKEKREELSVLIKQLKQQITG